ncbi:MAG: hypothetical protein J1F39_06340 [Clostridiales bacterium]|nr:hypothetical protein [Clostridiales bacterium]
MINIAKKRLPAALVSIFVYLSYCAAGWYLARSQMGYMGEQYSLPGWFANDIWAFFIAGLLPFALYAVLSMFVFRTLTVKIRGNVDAVRYGLNFAVFFANIVVFGLNFIFLAAPAAVGVMKTLLAPVVTILFTSLYLVYAFRQEYVDRSAFNAIVAQVLGTMITVYGIVAAIGIVSSVV